MAPKPVNLLNAMRSSAKSAPRPGATAVMETPAEAAQSSEPLPHRLGRAGKSNVTGYFPPAVKKQLRLLSAEHDKTIQRLLGEALNDLFAKYGKPEVAPLDDE